MSQAVRRPFTVAEYEAMGRAGILGPDDRVELIDGEILTMSPIGPGHQGNVLALSKLLERAVGDRAVVLTQGAVVLGDLNAPQPDIAVLRGSVDDYRPRLPGPGDILLVVEVSHTTLRFDRERKIPLYARFDIPDAWIVDVEAGTITVHRDPADGAYRSVAAFARGDHVAPSAFPDAALAVTAIVGPA